MDIKEINFVKVNGGNNTARYFITRFFIRIADLLFTLFDEGGEAGLGSINKDYFEIKYKAYNFEKYLNSGSGKAFSNKWFLSGANPIGSLMRNCFGILMPVIRCLLIV